MQTAPNPEDAPAAATATPPDPDHPLSAILLLSDGAQTTGLLEPRDAAEHAKSFGIPVFTIALGTPDGYVDGGGGGFGGGFGGGGGGGFRRPVPPDPATLAKVAEITGGEAFETTSDARLNQVYEDMASRFGKKTEWREATSLFLGAAALLAIAGGLLRCSGASACREGAVEGRRAVPAPRRLARSGRVWRVGEDGGDHDHEDGDRARAAGARGTHTRGCRGGPQCGRRDRARASPAWSTCGRSASTDPRAMPRAS